MCRQSVCRYIDRRENMRKKWISIICAILHISKLDTKRVERVEDVVAVGDAIVVKVTDIDQQGRINLSRKDAIAAIAKKRAEAAQQ